MQYSTLRSAYGVPALEEPKRLAQKSERDWMAPPPPVSSNMGSNKTVEHFPSPAPMPSHSPSVSHLPSMPAASSPPRVDAVPDYKSFSQEDSSQYRPPVPVPTPPAYFYGSQGVHPSSWQFPQELYKDVCALCRKTNDREVKMLILYIATGVFLITFIDILVRIAIRFAKKR